MAELRFLISSEQDGERADRILQQQLGEGWSRSDLQRCFAEGWVRCGSKKVRKSATFRAGELLIVEQLPEAVATTLLPEKIPLEIIYEDEELIVLNKPRGMVVHPGNGIAGGTLANALLYRFQSDLSTLNGPLRPGIVHRLDRDTSGVMVAAKTDRAHRLLSQQLQERTFLRRYRAIGWGLPQEEQGVWEGAIGRDPHNRLKMAIRSDGREARTHFKVVERWVETAEWELQLETGRTHQIRLHLQKAGFPVVGDPTYGGREQALQRCPPMEQQLLKPLLKLCSSQALQAVEIGFIHPATGVEMRFTAPPEAELEAARQFLRTVTDRLYPAEELP